MSSRQRIILLLVAAVVLAGGIALASSSDDDDNEGSTTAAETQTNETGGTEAPGETEKKEPPAPRVETIRIKGTKPVGGVKTLKYERGDTIAIRFSANEALEVHIHGFDTEHELEPGQPTVVRFKADLEGIFEIEEHDTEELLAKLEVRPK